MVKQCLVFVCATLAVVTGTCLETKHLQGLIPSCPSPVAATSLPLGYNNYLSFEALPSLPALGLASRVGLGLPVTDGPNASPITVVQAQPVTLPTVKCPIVPLPSQPIPVPKVLSQRCICTKTIVKPQIHQRLVTVPKIQRYFKRTVTPVVENVSYKTTPVSQKAVPLGSSAVVASASGYTSSAIVSKQSKACSC